MSRRVWIRWLPAMIAPVVVAGAALAWSLPAAAAVALPAKTPQQVLELAAGSSVTQFSGVLSESSQLGLPDIPTGIASSSASSSAPGSLGSLSSDLQLLTGSHTARVYVNGRTEERLQVTGSLTESDLVRNGNSVWTYDSKSNTATHLLLPAGATEHAPEATPSPSTVPTPESLAQGLLTKLAPSTRVTLGSNLRIAGRTAYDLILTPRTDATLVGSVSIAVDSRTGLPLSFQVTARGQHAPALQVAFTSLTLGAPAAALFDFTPPAGATVKTKTLTPTGHAQPRTGSTGTPATASPGGATRIGSGWTTIVELPAGALPSGLAGSSELRELTTPVTGGRVLRTALVNLLLTSDGRVFAGSVPVSALQAAAG